jgi:DNA-binding SARP family transcriptional activator
VKILALAPGHRLHREKVMDLLWPDESPDKAAPKLHKAAYFARRAAGSDDAVVLRDDVVWLFPDADLTVDVERFETLSRAAVAADDAELARQALAWYEGELLPADCYEDWVVDRRELLHLRRLDVLRVAGDWRELTELDPTDEDAHVRVMHEHFQSGDTGAAIRQYRQLERVLDRELGLSPSTDAARRVDELLETLAELERRQRQVLAELAAVGALV